ncbi:cytochrome c1 [Mangrovibrevibacter kandeliae]|uniref:cytochrome c1 n=1 Tax=Mangrovibrevibacter kandeliae TaxID=2968473 RepID=UPI002118E559|nr:MULTISPECIES: cytochrome c1 [unclassified Aurantimonas]MCQ8781012.1 cytochrome c1 [Aurantimonas sp. CSK15Z-1]MCW4113792.1 cytochrome c1 [Aurantimonas sp. MSK8Z-1]
MNRLFAALLAAGVVLAPAAFAQQDNVTPAPSPDAATTTPSGEAGPAGGEAADHGAGDAAASGEHGTVHYPLKHPPELSWTFAGPFGHWDIAQLQRGYKVYKEVCSSCHSMDLVAFRNLSALGYEEGQIKAIAAEYTVQDGPNGDGDMFDRPAIGSDHFPHPFPNPEAAAAANNGAAPPDLSLIAKAREVERGFPTFLFDIFTQYNEGGPDYVHALLTGYGQDAPAGITIQPGTHYNPYFISGPALAMPPPLSDGQVTYDDGSPETTDQYARDVGAFLMWAAEPHLVERKATGFVVIIFLLVFAGLVYTVKKRVWAGAH